MKFLKAKGKLPIRTFKCLRGMRLEKAVKGRS